MGSSRRWSSRRSRCEAHRWDLEIALLSLLTVLGAAFTLGSLTALGLIADAYRPEWTAELVPRPAWALKFELHLGLRVSRTPPRAKRPASRAAHSGVHCADGCPTCDNKRVLARLHAHANRTRSIEPTWTRRMHMLEPRRALLQQGGVLLFTHLRRTGGSSLEHQLLKPRLTCLGWNRTGGCWVGAAETRHALPCLTHPVWSLMGRCVAKAVAPRFERWFLCNEGEHARFAVAGMEQRANMSARQLQSNQ